MDFQSHYGFSKAMCPRVGVEVDRWVVGELRQDRGIFGVPPVMVFKDNKDDLLVVVLRSDV